MKMREKANEFSLELRLSRNTPNSPINSSTSLYTAVQRLPHNMKQSVKRWLDKGPFSDDALIHDSNNHLLECGGEMVTGTAVGEAAYASTVGVDIRLVSFDPSDWAFTPVVARLVSNHPRDTAVSNYWQPPVLKAALRDAELPPTSWGEMAATVTTKFQRLTFSSYCFDDLDGRPFAPGAAQNIIKRLAVLDQLMGAIDATGRRTPEGHRLYQDHFTGDRANFSDSSDSEKNKFREKLTFPHPDQSGTYLFCTWHGKVNNPPYRIHFSWPVLPGAPLYIVYVGWKITV